MTPRLTMRRNTRVRYCALRGLRGLEAQEAVRVVNQTLNGLRLEKQPEKTFIGRIERGFDFLGYHLRPGRLAVAQKTVERFVERARRLYEQGPGGGLPSSRRGRGAWASGPIGD